VHSKLLAHRAGAKQDDVVDADFKEVKDSK
jgi:hypothetical protein